MKKISMILIVLVALSSMIFAGGNSETDESGAGKGYNIALITDLGPVDDKSFNQGAWEGVVSYAKEFGVTYKYYRPAEDSAVARLDSIALAIRGGAEIIVCPGFLFGEVIFEAQDAYPNTKFILLDADPHNASFSEFRIEKNVMSIYYAEEQGGFIVGYAAVKEGMTNLAFFGGVSVPAVIRYGVGFVEGAEYAAKEDDVNVSIMYKYLGSFDSLPEYKTLASSWYNNGTDTIFVAAGGAINNAISAAEELGNKTVIGCNVNQMDASETIITSSLKQLKDSVYAGLKDYYAGEFKGGQITKLNAAEGGVAMPDDYSRFSNFNKSDYDTMFAKLVDGTISVTSDIGVSIHDGLNLSRTTVTVVE